MSAGELIPLDEGGLVTCEYFPMPNRSQRMGNSGNSLNVRYGPTKWRLQVRTRPDLSEEEARVWTPWLQRRESFTFTAPRLMRVIPKGHIDTADGALTLTVDIGAGTLAIGGVGAATAKKGDMVSYRTANSGYYVGEVQADAVAAAGAITVSVLPQPVAKHASTPAVRRVQALGEFEMTTDPGAIDVYDTRQVAFEAIQTLR